MTKKYFRNSTYYGEQNMKSITNTSLQSWSLPLRTPKGIEDFYLTPRQTIKVPASYITEDAIRYQKRKLVAIKNA